MGLRLPEPFLAGGETGSQPEPDFDASAVGLGAAGGVSQALLSTRPPARLTPEAVTLPF